MSYCTNKLDCRAAVHDVGCRSLERTLFDLDPEEAFDGQTYEPDKDFERLTGQMRAVYMTMRDGRWRTLAELAQITGYPEASVSARLRDLRKARLGAHTVDRRRVAGGLWEYRVHAPSRDASA